ncbi:hypothetical protein [Ferrovum sp.]|uniref:hypothetical protein n=1 Tax=Ferrovum sp. TaxID=2609467 RepID=UPI002636D956|nr:hypothetical protein [Ferrovum sp.]
MKFRKKPVIIEARQLTNRNVVELVDWIDEAVDEWHASENEDYSYILIKTLEGNLKAKINDWIIQGVKGEFYPCKPDIFEATYEPANESESIDVLVNGETKPFDPAEFLQDFTDKTPMPSFPLPKSLTGEEIEECFKRADYRLNLNHYDQTPWHVHFARVVELALMEKNQ